jgi:hypothetical protein
VGGTLALVMPVSLMSGEAWDASRALLAKRYKDLVLVSIAGTGGSDLSFSADTDIGECLVVGQKSEKGGTRATFVVLKSRPAFPMVGASAARQIRQLIAQQTVRSLEDGPVGGTPINFGNDVIGYAINAPLPASGSWNLARIADLALGQSAYQLASNGRLWLPGMPKSAAATIAITTVKAIGEIGPYHADINGTTSTGGIRGPFVVSKVKPHSAPTYPVLWSHDANSERTMAFEGDSEGQPRKATKSSDRAVIEHKVDSIAKTASHCHFNQNFRFNSQSTSMQFTERPTIGARAWLSIRLKSVEQEKALVLWANTSIGLLLHWWHANKQQAGRGNIGKSALESLPILDVSKLKKISLSKGANLFDAMKGKPLLPFNEIEKDAVRRELDERFVVEVLGLPPAVVAEAGPLELLRMKLGREPSVCGQKVDHDEDETGE